MINTNPQVIKVQRVRDYGCSAQDGPSTSYLVFSRFRDHCARGAGDYKEIVFSR